MKKCLVWLLIAALALTLIGCGNNTPTEDLSAIDGLVEQGPDNQERQPDATPDPDDAPTREDISAPQNNQKEEQPQPNNTAPQEDPKETAPADKSHTHTWAEATCTTPKTCTECKETSGSPLKHKVVEASCTAGKHCTLCNKSYSEPLGHKFVNDTCKTCQQKVDLPITVEYTENMAYNGAQFKILQCDIMNIDKLEQGGCTLDVFTQCVSAGENCYTVLMYDKDNVTLSSVVLDSTSVPGDTQLNNCPIPKNTVRIVITFA